MGEIRIVGPGETRGYPYPVCKNRLYRQIVGIPTGTIVLLLQLTYFCYAMKESSWILFLVIKKLKLFKFLTQLVWGQNPERKVTLNILGTSWQPVSI